MFNGWLRGLRMDARQGARTTSRSCWLVTFATLGRHGLALHRHSRRASSRPRTPASSPPPTEGATDISFHGHGRAPAQGRRDRPQGSGGRLRQLDGRRRRPQPDHQYRPHVHRAQADEGARARIRPRSSSGCAAPPTPSPACASISRTSRTSISAAASPRASTSTRCSRATPTRCTGSRRSCASKIADARRAARRHHRPLHQEPADDGRDRPREGGGLRHHRRPDPPGAVQRLRLAPGRDHLHAVERLPGHPGEHAGVPDRHLGACRRSSSRPARTGQRQRCARRRRQRHRRADRPVDPAQRRHEAGADGRPAAGQPPGPAAVGDDLVQPRARLSRSARRSTRSSRSSASRTCRPSITTGFQGTAQVFQEFAEGAGHPGPGRDLRRLRGARHPLRELHPPDHHHLRPAVGRHRRAADADAVQDGPVGDRHDRHRHAGRHRQEERDHDDRLRDRAPARRARRRRRRSARPACCASGRS